MLANIDKIGSEGAADYLIQIVLGKDDRSKYLLALAGLLII